MGEVLQALLASGAHELVSKTGARTCEAAGGSHPPVGLRMPEIWAARDEGLASGPKRSVGSSAKARVAAGHAGPHMPVEHGASTDAMRPTRGPGLSAPISQKLGCAATLGSWASLRDSAQAPLFLFNFSFLFLFAFLFYF